MTDYIETLLSSMSTKFNDGSLDTGEVAGVSKGCILDLNKDKTTKWRSLKKNVNAKNWSEKVVKKSYKNLNTTARIFNKSDVYEEGQIIKNKYGCKTPNLQVEVQLGLNRCVNSNDKSEFLIDKEEKNGPFQLERDAAKPTTMSPNKPRYSFDLPVRRLRRAKLPETEELSPDACIYSLTSSENVIELLPLKRRGRSKNSIPLKVDKIISNESDLVITSEKRSQRKRKQTIDVELENSRIDDDREGDEARENVSDKEKKTRRSIRLEHRNEVKIENPSDDEIKVELQGHLKSRQHTSDANTLDLITVLSVQQRKIETERTPPKKRGRRAKASTNEKQCSYRDCAHINDISPNSYFPEIKRQSVSKDCTEVLGLVVPKRSQRRIKPTPKILENNELRYEFETKNIERITSCIDSEIDSVQFVSSKTNLSRSSSRHRDIKSENSTESQLQHPSNIVKKKTYLKYAYCMEKSNSETKPCPDMQVFLTEVRAGKWHHNNSPEEKKMNRKQQHKLMKQKQKHMERLGLQRTHSCNSSESANTSDDNEEFIPSKRVQVGKTNVKLRVRGLKESTTQVFVAKNSLQKPQSEITIEDNLPDGKQKAPSINLPNLNHLLDPKDLICLCHLPSYYYTQKTPDTFFCCAVDQIDEQKVGCCNKLNGELLNLLRPSSRVGYMILCNDHVKRFRAHNCCAGCGIFCTQGKFSFCKKQHFFHPDCAQKFILNSPYDPTLPGNFDSPTLVIKCPHCGIDTPEKTSSVTMKCQPLPIFLPSQNSNIKLAHSDLPIVKLSINAVTKNINKDKRNTFEAKVVSFESLIPESVMNVVGRTNRRRANSEFSPKDMYYAVKNDDLERVAEILGSGYDVTSYMHEFLGGTCLHLVAYSGTLQMAYLLLCKEFPQDFVNMTDRDLKTASMCAVMSDKCDILNLFTQCGADLGAKGPEGKTCLHIAAKLGHFEAVKILVEAYKNSKSVTSFVQFINAQDEGGWTAMVWAAELGHTQIVSLLLNNGSEPNICDKDNNTVLHWATLYNGSLDTINLLLQAGSNCNIQNVHGDTPLHIACRNSTTRLSLALIANGADLMIKNKANELPYDCIPQEDSQCARSVGFNMQMRSFAPMGLRNRVVSSDISNGREDRPIQAVKNEYNMIATTVELSRTSSDESEEIMFADFKYITKNIILQNPIRIDHRISTMRICSCRDGCVTDQCQCTSASVQNWYTIEGRLKSNFNYEDPPIIFECNDVCGCNKLICKNRIVQYGIKLPLQVNECDEQAKGWGVRALINVPKGSFVSEYTGEILSDFEADQRRDDSYFFDIGHDHCIDANYYGNISRFFNHSCEPNLVPVRVFFDHQDFRFPKIALFSNRNIPIGEEMW